MSRLSKTRRRTFNSLYRCRGSSNMGECFDADYADRYAGRTGIFRTVKQEAIARAKEGNPMFGRTRGVLSNIVNQVSSGSIIVTAVAAIASVTGSESIGVAILILAGAAIFFLYWFFIQNVFPVVVRRIFLEGLAYHQVTAQRFLFLLRIKKWAKASWMMFVTSVFLFLWSFTIAGAFIKRYSYFLVPLYCC